MKSGIYQILNKVNGKSYIGSAIDINNRWKKHRYSLRNNKNSSFLQNAWNKYGEDVWQWNVLEYVSNPEWLIEIEQYWIDFLETSNVKFGYNICPIAGNTLGYKHTKEVKIKMSEERRGSGNQGWVGRRHTEETKAKMSKAKKGKPSIMLGKKHTEETKRKIGETNKVSQKGKKHTEETKRKISESMKKVFNRRSNNLSE